MAKISEECLQEAYNALRNFDKRDLQDYVREVYARARELDPNQGAVALDKAMQEIDKQRLKTYFNDATRKAKDVLAYQNNAKPIMEGKADLRGLIAGRQLRKWLVVKVSDWRKRNIPDAVKAQYEKNIKFITGDLTNDEIEQFSSGKHDNDIAKVVDGGKTSDPFIQKMADKVRSWRDYATSELLISGAMTAEELHPKRILSQIHDQQKIINGGKSWIKESFKRKPINRLEAKNWFRNHILSRIDIYETFKKTDAVDLNGNIDMERVKEIIDKNFDDITTGKSDIIARSMVVRDAEALARRSRMFYVWKSFNDQLEYNKVAGQGNLFNMLIRDAQSMSHKVGVTRMWGTNPLRMYNDLRAVQLKVNPHNGTWWTNTDNYYKAAMHLDRTSTAPNVANLASNLQTLTMMARLPLVALASTSDMGYIASFANRIGHNYYRALGNHLSHVFDSFPTEERTRIARLMKAQVDSHLGYLGRWTDQNNVSAWLNKISTRYFKANLLEAFDRGNKISAMHIVAKTLYEASNDSWDKLHPPTQKFLNRFINAKEWDLLRRKNNTKLFTTDNVDALSSEELRQHYQTTDKSIPLAELQDDLYRRVYAMFTVAAENTVLAPAEFERAFLHRGTDPGEAAGVLLRAVTQFKMYPLAFIDRVLIDGLNNADTIQQKIIWATTMMSATIPLSYMSMFFKNAAMNQTMPDWDQMNVPAREKYLIEMIAPSLGLFSGMLDARNQNSSLVMSLIGSPTTNLVFNGLSIPLALASGNPKHALKQAEKTASYFLPTQTTPILTPILDRAMGREAFMEPGQQPLIQ